MKSTLITTAIITLFTFALTSCQQKPEESHEYVIRVISVDSIGYSVAAIDKVNRGFDVGDTVIIERSTYSASDKWIITNDDRIYKNITGLQSASGVVRKRH